MYAVGAKFDASVSLNYTRLSLYSNETQVLGNYSQIFSSNNQTLINNILNFYKIFQKQTGYVDLIEQVVKAYSELTLRKEFYFFFNDLYWYLPLKQPYVHITYNKIPLPGTV